MKSHEFITEHQQQLEENLRDWFKQKWVRFGPDGKIRGDCARGSESEGKPKCLPQAKAHALGKDGRASAAARKRRQDPDANRQGAAINVATKKKVNENHESCPHCGNAMYPIHMIAEKKDACYYKVKASAKVWPSAYASGRLVQCRKKGAANYGNKSESAVTESNTVAEARAPFRGVGGAFDRGDDEHHEIDREREQQAQLGTWYIRINGKILKTRDGQPYTFRGKAAANKAAVTMLAKPFNAGKKFTLTANPNDKETGVNEMDKLQTPSGRDGHVSHGTYGSRDKKDPDSGKKQYTAKGITSNQATNVATGILSKAFTNSQRVDPRTGKKMVQKGVAEVRYSEEEANAIFDDFEQAMDDRGLTEDIFNLFTDEEIILETAAWRRSAGKSKKGGLNAKGVASYRRENPGSKLQMAVTTKPSKLKPGSKAAKRRKSFCARMGGVKGPMKKPNGKPTRKALALRKWNC